MLYQSLIDRPCFELLCILNAVRQLLYTHERLLGSDIAQQLSLKLGSLLQL